MICYDYINDFIRKTLRPETGILKELGEYARKNGIPILHREAAALIRVLALLQEPQRILEVGTAVGYSAILLASTLKQGGRVDTIERDEDSAVQAAENIRKEGLENKISVIVGEALEVLRCLDTRYDLIFLDAAKGQYPEFLPECLRLLRPGGLLISDNVLYRGMVASEEPVTRRKRTIVMRMREYLDTICSADELETSIVPIGDGIAVSYKKLCE